MRVCFADRSRLMSVCTVSITEKPIPKTYPALWCILGLCLKVVHEVTNRFVNPLLEKCIFESLLHLLKIEAMGIFYRQSLVLKQNKNTTTKQQNAIFVVISQSVMWVTQQQVENTFTYRYTLTAVTTYILLSL